jgi:hypothetical protein
MTDSRIEWLSRRRGPRQINDSLNQSRVKIPGGYEVRVQVICSRFEMPFLFFVCLPAGHRTRRLQCALQTELLFSILVFTDEHIKETA